MYTIDAIQNFLITALLILGAATTAYIAWTIFAMLSPTMASRVDATFDMLLGGDDYDWNNETGHTTPRTWK